MLENTENRDETLLDELLKDDIENETEDIGKLFDNEDEKNKFLEQFPSYLIGLWAQNDKIIHIVTPTGVSEAMKTAINNINVPLQKELQPVYEQLRDAIQYNEMAEETGIRIITLKQIINITEVFTAHSWASDPQVDLYEVLNKRNLTIQPTMEELRLLLLIDTLLEIRENQQNKVVAVTGMPQRLPKGLR